MRLKDFLYFSTIAKFKSYSKAADELFISQPTLSQAILRLENELGVRLLDRDNTTVSLTTAGKIFLEDADEILASTEKLKKKMKNISESNYGTIRVGTSQFYGSYIFPVLIPSLKENYPGIKIEITEESSYHLEKLVENGDLDFAFIPLPITSDRITSSHMFDEKILLAVPDKPGIYCKLNLTPDKQWPYVENFAALSDENFMLLKKNMKLRIKADELCENAGFRPNVIIESQNMETLRNYVALGMGISFLSHLLAGSNKTGILYYQLQDYSIVRDFVLIYLKNNPLSSMEKSFIQVSKEALSVFHCD
jgi:LysR family hydrogen peroxide-inducible transcriptional activator